jgi:hypothetical protein
MKGFLLSRVMPQSVEGVVLPPAPGLGCSIVLYIHISTPSPRPIAPVPFRSRWNVTTQLDVKPFDNRVGTPCSVVQLLPAHLLLIYLFTCPYLFFVSASNIGMATDDTSPRCLSRSPREEGRPLNLWCFHAHPTT